MTIPNLFRTTTLNFIIPFRTKEITHAVLFESHLLAIAIAKIHVIVIAVLHKIHLGNQINRAGYTLLIYSHEIIKLV